LPFYPKPPPTTSNEAVLAQEASILVYDNRHQILKTNTTGKADISVWFHGIQEMQPRSKKAMQV